MLLPLPLGLGWRTSLLYAAACYPFVIMGATAANPFSQSIGALTQRTTGPLPAAVAHTGILAVLFLPPLLVLCLAVTKAVRTSRPPAEATWRRNRRAPMSPGRMMSLHC